MVPLPVPTLTSRISLDSIRSRLQERSRCIRDLLEEGAKGVKSPQTIMHVHYMIVVEGERGGRRMG